MDPLKIDQKHLESIRSRFVEKGIYLPLEEVNRVAILIKDEMLYCDSHQNQEAICCL